MSAYVDHLKEKKLFIPLLAEAAFILLIRVLPLDAVYLYFFFYAFLTAYFYKQISAKKMIRSVRDAIREHPVALAVTVIVLALVYVFREELREAVALLFGEAGTIGVWTRTTGEYFLYAFTMVLLMPVAEGLFFRWGLISFRESKETVLTVVVSLVLNVLLHVNAPSGAPILLASALPLVVLYLITKDVHLTILIHMLYCLPLYLKYVIYAFARIMLR